MEPCPFLTRQNFLGLVVVVNFSPNAVVVASFCLFGTALQCICLFLELLPLDFQSVHSFSSDILSRSSFDVNVVVPKF